jgi:hypothetical protein
MFRFQIHTEIEVNATPERIWEILTDFASYPEWNPFIRMIRGNPRAGERLIIRIQPKGAKGMTFRPRILCAEVGRELRWRGRVLFPGIFDGEHRFLIQPLADRKVLLQHSEEFSGVLVPFLRNILDRDTKRGFEEMNPALKARAEVPSS